jgi:hypothetical protein
MENNWRQREYVVIIVRSYIIVFVLHVCMYVGIVANSSNCFLNDDSRNEDDPILF